MNHHYRTPADCTSSHDSPCMVCDGGLSVCRDCHLFEGCLTSDCPGHDCFAAQSAAVYRGQLDFRDGRWVEAPSPHCPGGLNLAAQEDARVREMPR